MGTSMGEQGGSSPESAAEWAALQRSYVELRTELQLTDDPREQVQLLRRLADFRAQLARLDEAIEGSDPGDGGGPDDTDAPDGEPQLVVGEITSEIPAIGRLGPPLTEVVIADASDETSSANRAGPTEIDLRDGTADAASTDQPIDLDHGESAGGTIPPARRAAIVADWPGLTLRFIIEGPPGAGTTTVVNQLAEQFSSPRTIAPLLDGAIDLHWFEFTSGSFDGQPIRFEICSLQGAADRRIRRRIRSMVDAVILVVDSTPEGLGVASTYVGELQEDREQRDEIEAPELAVFAHKEDLERALSTEVVALQLSLPGRTKVVSTTRERPGSLYSFGLATSSAVRRAHRRDTSDLSRTAPMTDQAFLTWLHDGLHNQPAPRPASGPPPSILTQSTSEIPSTEPDSTGRAGTNGRHLTESELNDSARPGPTAPDTTDNGLDDPGPGQSVAAGGDTNPISSVPLTTTEAAGNGVIDLAAIGRSASDDADRGQPGAGGPDDAADSPPDTANGGAGRLLDESTMNGWGIGSSPEESGSTDIVNPAEDSAEVEGDLQPPPFIAGRRHTRPRNEHSIPPSVLDDQEPSVVPGRPAARNQPVDERPAAADRHSEPRPIDEPRPGDEPGSLFGPRPTPSRSWPPAPAAEDHIDFDENRLGPANRAALANSGRRGGTTPYRHGAHHGSSRRSALRRLIEALRG